MLGKARRCPREMQRTHVEKWEVWPWIGHGTGGV